MSELLNKTMLRFAGGCDSLYVILMYWCAFCQQQQQPQQKKKKNPNNGMNIVSYCTLCQKFACHAIEYSWINEPIWIKIWNDPTIWMNFKKIKPRPICKDGCFMFTFGSLKALHWINEAKWIQVKNDKKFFFSAVAVLMATKKKTNKTNCLKVITIGS